MKVTKKVWREVKDDLVQYGRGFGESIAEYHGLSAATISLINNTKSHADYKRRIKVSKPTPKAVSPIQALNNTHMNAVSKLDQMIKDLEAIKKDLQ